MKKFLKTLIPLIILGALVYQFRVPLESQFLPLLDNAKSSFFPQTPCAEPIPYNLGTFDTQFNISKSYFLSALGDAEATWEKPVGRELFTYAPTDLAKDVLKINLIYDYRQQATSKLASLGITVNNDRASYNMLKAKLAALKAQYNEEKAALPQVDRKDQQSAIDHINSLVDEINALVVVLNRLVDTLNLSVDKYNTVSVSRGESFEEGVYTSDGLTSQIDIYEFSDRAKLVRVLAHELGHALSLDHVDDPKAIMYEFNQSNSEILTATDLAALKARCGIK